MRKLLIFLLGIIFSIVVYILAVQIAQNKPFWNDEIYDIVTIPNYSYISLLRGEILQSNNNPLYSMLQKFVLSTTHTYDDTILIRFRLVSIISACLLILFLFYYVSLKWGVGWAIFTLVSLINQSIFFRYAAESRHYMLWLLCFTILVLFTTSICLQSFNNISLKQKIYFVLACLMNTLVISMGAIQAVAAIFVCLFFWLFIHPFTKKSMSAIWFALTLGIIFISIELFYGLHRQGIYGSFKGSHWDLLLNIHKGDYSLIKMPLRLMFPKILRDGYAGFLLSNLFVLIGASVPIMLWKKRRSLIRGDLMVFVLSISTLVQVLATLAIGAIIAYNRFYFVQRVFLYLIICHSLLALSGGVFVFQFLFQKIQARFIPWMTFLEYSILGILIFLSFLWLAGQYRQYYNKITLPSCEFLNNKLNNDLQDIGLHGDTINFCAETGKHLKQRHWLQDTDWKGLYLWQNTEQ